MKQSDTLSELAKALAAAQGTVENASKDAKNSHFNNRYATLEAVWDAIRAPFTNNGLSIVQVTETPASGPVLLTTRLLHTSGEWLEGDYPIQPVKNDPQGFGSALTYARRYTLMAMAGIAPEDDDGNAGSQGIATTGYVAPVRKAAPPQAAPVEEETPEQKARREKADLIRDAIAKAETVRSLDAIMALHKDTLADFQTSFPPAYKFLTESAVKKQETLKTKEAT